MSVATKPFGRFRKPLRQAQKDQPAQRPLEIELSQAMEQLAKASQGERRVGDPDREKRDVAASAVRPRSAVQTAAQRGQPDRTRAFRLASVEPFAGRRDRVRC